MLFKSKTSLTFEPENLYLCSITVNNRELKLLLL